MIDPPSPGLSSTLFDLNLCAPADLKRCRHRVRRLAHDVPAFDSIWLDALLQARKLTPFQAQILESSDRERLCVGPCVLVDQLGRGVEATTYLARRREGTEQVVLKMLDRPLESLEADLERLTELTHRLRRCSHHSAVGPHTALRHGDRLVAISQHVQGLHLGELMIRRGRFPPEIVADIARQLLEGLAALESVDCLHGDVRLNNVRLTSTGVAVLVDAGVRPAITPELTILSRVPPDRYDGVAPELIGTGQTATAPSDLYGLGCLLWHLLAGRPPFPTGDPLAKLASHQTRRVTDVREWAPDTPAQLAEEISRLTNSVAAERPQSMREALSVWGPPRRSSRSRLARFRAQFNTTAPGSSSRRSKSRSKLPLVLLLLFVFSGAAVTLFDSGARNQLLRLGSSSSASRLATDDDPSDTPAETVTLGTSSKSGDLETIANHARLPELPGPDRDNVITLAPRTSYDVADIAGIGTLTIRGPKQGGATILVAEQPLKIWAETLVLENVTFARNGWVGHSSGVAAALVQAETQNLTIRNCRFETHSLETIRSSPAVSDRIVAVAWKLINKPDASGGQVDIDDSVFLGTRSAVFLASAPRHVGCRNNLKIGAGPYFTLSGVPPRGADLRMQLERLTLRRSETLLRWQPASPPVDIGRISIEANDCVLDITGENTALFQLAGHQRSADLLASLELFGEGSLASSELVVARRFDARSGAWALVDSSAVAVEGILKMAYEFAGGLTDDRRDSLIKSHNAPRRHASAPGIAVEGGGGE